MKSDNTELIKLIHTTESMDSVEKKYWLYILPYIKEEHVDSLFIILDTERKKLDELEVRYQEDTKKLNEKDLVEWQEFQSKGN